MLPFRLVCHPEYNLDLGDHVFPAVKYRMVRDRLLESAIASPEDFVQPEPAGDEDLELVHSADWIRRLRTGTLTPEEVLRLELPYSEAIIRGFWLAAGGSILAARLALKDRIGFNIGGGFHHAYAGHGEGFCAVNDIAVAVRRLQKDGEIRTAMVVDVDVHHGNGTAAIFLNDPSVFTLSIHQFDNYPLDKPRSSLDVHLQDGVGDTEYLKRLNEACLPAIESFRPDLLIYVAGVSRELVFMFGGFAHAGDGCCVSTTIDFSRHFAPPLSTLMNISRNGSGDFRRQVCGTRFYL